MQTGPRSQKALHVCLLPNAETFVNMLSRSPNPYEAKIGGKHFLGSDGLNITDLRRFIAKKVVKGNADEVDDEGNIIG
jgi:DNA polymerase II small subunit/DNA polymerase delta subunit B